MKLRIIVAAILVPMLLYVTLFLPEIVTACFVSFFAAVAAYEILHNTKLVRNFRMVIYSMMMAFFIGLWSFYGCDHVWALGAIILFFVLMFTELMLSDAKIAFNRVGYCFMGGVVIPYMFSAISRIIVMDFGRFYILLPFLVAYMSDGGAYFVGIFFGKHKMAPIISPKKTWEGFFGGLAASVIGMLIYSLVLQLGFGLRVNYLFAAIFGLVGALAGVFGDLCFSVIKRQTGIKDYGNIFPGHGGVLDRFDSVIMTAPLVEFLLMIMTLAD